MESLRKVSWRDLSHAFRLSGKNDLQQINTSSQNISFLCEHHVSHTARWAKFFQYEKRVSLKFFLVEYAYQLLSCQVTVIAAYCL